VVYALLGLGEVFKVKLLGLDVEDVGQLGGHRPSFPLGCAVLPLTHLLQQPEDILSLAALETFEGLVLLVIIIREGDDIIFDLAQHGGTDIEGDLELSPGGSFLVFVAQIGDLQLYLAELGDDIMEAVAEDRVLLVLVNLQVQLLEELVFSLDELLLADAEEDGNLRGQPPELLVLDHAGALGVVLLPETEAVLELEDINRIIFNLVVVVVGAGHSGDE
jgi:hypothetical protein